MEFRSQNSGKVVTGVYHSAQVKPPYFFLIIYDCCQYFIAGAVNMPNLNLQ